MNIDVIDATPAEKHVLANLLELYQYDFTEFSDEDVGEDGRFGMAYLDRYFTGDPTRLPLLLRVEGHWAGLALLHRGGFLVDDPEMMDVVEFFVMRKYRRKGVATEFARRIFARFPGPWEVRVVHNNAPAQAFWRGVVGHIAGRRYDERQWDDKDWHGPVIFFDNAAANGGLLSEVDA
jgi:predicted acetyltransferase